MTEPDDTLPEYAHRTPDIDDGEGGALQVIEERPAAAEPVYVTGELLRVAVQGTVTLAMLDRLQLQLADGSRVNVDVAASGADVARLLPADGAPRPEDVWADRDGVRWWATAARPDADVEFVPSGADDTPPPALLGRHVAWAQLNENRGPLRLIWREDRDA